MNEILCARNREMKDKNRLVGTKAYWATLNFNRIYTSKKMCVDMANEHAFGLFECLGK